MTPKEKAQELVDKFMDYSQYKLNEKHNMSNVKSAKQCAIIAVDEILKDYHQISNNLWVMSRIEYWQEVKNEIEKL
jgi:hypothetical protein